MFLVGLKVQEEVDDDLCQSKRQNQEKRDDGYGRLGVIPSVENRLVPIEGSFDIGAGHRENATLAVV